MLAQCLTDSFGAHVLCVYFCMVYRTLYFVENSTNSIKSIHMDGNSSSINVVRNSSLPVVDLAVDAEKNLLFWSSGTCIYKYDLVERSDPYPMICDYEDYGPPTLLAYYNDDVFALDKEGMQYIYFVDEVNSELPPAVIVFALQVYGLDLDAVFAIQDMIFIDPSVQPGNLLGGNWVAMFSPC